MINPISMKKRLLTMAAGALLLAAPMTVAMQAQEQIQKECCGSDNPFMKPYPDKYGIPPFEQIKNVHFLPAIKAGLEQQKENIEAILKNRATPDFDNTILPLENVSPILDRVAGVFLHYQSAMQTDEIRAIADEAIPLLNEASNAIYLNDALFARIKAVKDNADKLKLTKVQKRVVDKYYKQFSELGAALPADKKAELVKINDRLSKLFVTFVSNALNATNSFYVTVYDKADLAGIPESAVSQAAHEANQRGLDGMWVFTLQASSRLPVLEYADNRGLREAIYKGYTTLASYGQYDNRPVIQEIIKLRKQKADLMGFDNFAQMMTSRVMAGTPEAAEQLLLQVFEPAVKRAHEEVADMQKYVNDNGGDFKIAPWDYYYYANKVKQEKFNLSESEVRPYFEVNNVVNGLFHAAEKLYGIKMVEMPDAPKYMEEVKVYDVQDAKTGEHIAVFMTDFFPRATKRQGAWMEQLQSAGIYEDGKSRRPVVYNVGNFTPPTKDMPSLLTIDEVETTFHEFGHALQGMLTKAPYRSIAGTNVDRDYVEMSSQMNEHFAFTPELLKYYAKHYKTGEAIPDELIEKLNKSSKFNQGFMTTELAGAALLDLAWGKNDGENVDVLAFEKQVADNIGMPEEITFRYRSPYFQHIFADDAGYASGYYTYLWSQVLEADAWELFEKNGVFNPKTAASYKKNILESGDTEDAMVLFTRFRGHKPDPNALLRMRGFIK